MLVECVREEQETVWYVDRVCCVVPFCVMMCCAMLCYAMLCYAVLCCVVVCYVVLYCIVLRFVTLLRGMISDLLFVKSHQFILAA